MNLPVPSLLLFISSLVSLGLSAFIFTRRHAPGASALGVLSLLIAEWALTYGMEIAAPDLNAKIFWGRLQYIGIAFIPFSWLLFSAFYTRRENLAHRLNYLYALGVLPLLTVIFALTNGAHGLIWSKTFLKPAGEIVVLGVQYGVWFWVHFAASYLFLLGGSAVVLRGLRRMQGLYRAQVLALFFAVLLPWVGNVAYFVTPIVIDPTPFAFNITIALLVWAIFGYNLTDIAPIARDLIVEEMREGILALDMQGRIVDVNAKAAHFIGLNPSQILGKPAADVLQPWRSMWERFRGALEAREIVQVGSGEAVRNIEIRLSPLYDRRSNLIGKLFIFREAEEPAVASPRRVSEPLTVPLPRVAAEEPFPAQPDGFGERLASFFSPKPLRLNQNQREDSVWTQTIERIFTITTRDLAALVTPFWIFSIGYFLKRNVFLLVVVGGVLLVLWMLALARQAEYRVRIAFFLTILYFGALTAGLSYGFSPESFSMFLFFITLGGMFLEGRGRFWVFLTGFATVAALGGLIVYGGYIPFAVQLSRLRPSSLETFIASLLAFGLLSGGLTSIVHVVFINLKNSIQKEIQSRNLLQQERDLLEQRVLERTAELRETRDQALRSRDELRTYYQAMEQSGNSIVITDPRGDIEYVNPFFEKSTGYSIQEVIGKNPRILKSGAQSLDFYRRMWKTIAGGHVWQGEFLNKRKDGSLYWEFATIAPVKDQQEKITHYVAIKEDVTAQKELRDTLARQNEYLAILQTVTLELLDRRDRQELLDNILQRARETLHASLGAIALWEDGQLVFRAVAADRRELYGQPVSREFMPLVWRAFETRLPVIVDDYLEKYGVYQALPGQTLHAVADFPIISGNQTLGVIALGRSETAFPFSASQIEFGQSLAQIAALVLDNATLYDSALRELEERKKIQTHLEVSEQEQRALASILQIGMSEKPLESILLAAMDDLLAIEWLGVEAKGGVFLKDPAGDSLLLTAQRNLSPEINALCARVKFGQCLCGRAALSRQLQFASHLNELHEITYDGIPDHGHYNIPILLSEEVLGVVVLYLSPGYAYNERDVRFLHSFAGILGNIIRRKRTEELLRESEVRFRQIVENAGDIIYRMDERGRMTYVNPVGLRIMGYADESEALGKHFTEFAVPSWRPRVKAFYKRQALQNQQNTYYEFQALAKDGRQIWLGQNVQIIRQPDGTIGFQAVARDITELKETQRELEKARDQALEASRFKSQLVSRVSHELRTPLGGVLGYSELLYQGAFGPLNEEQQSAVGDVVASANYLNIMINELLDQAQIEARAVKIHLAPFQPSRLLENIRANMTILALNKGLRFASELDPALPPELIGDERRLQQVLINLAGNAIKFTEQGEVRVSLVKLSDSQWALRVADTGAGIPKEAQSYIFDAFRQVDNAITRHNRGTGLGLSITRELVELMGGRMELESEIGRGSVFTAIFPLQLP